MVQTNPRTGQLYGYAVCLICVIVFLVSLNGILGSAFDLTDPVRADYHGGMGAEFPLTSFPAYKIAVRRQAENRPRVQAEFVGSAARLPGGSATNNPPATVSDDELKQNYEAEREERIGAVRFRAMRSLVIGLIFVLLTGALFVLHWKWLRRAGEAA